MVAQFEREHDGVVEPKSVDARPTVEAALAQFTWIWRLNAEGGLFIAIGLRAA